MVAKNPWLPLYGEDFIQSEFVRLLPRDTRWIYLELLWHAWREGSIPRDPDALASLFCPDDPERFASVHWPLLAPKWDPSTGAPNARLINRRLEDERQARSLKQESGRRGGKQTASKRSAHGPANGKQHE